MAANKKKAKNKQNKPAQKKGILKPERKLEMLGIVIMALAVLLALSIGTYRSGDYAIISSVSFSELMQLDSTPALRIQNGLGPLGAYLAHFFVDILFGYPTLLIAALAFVIGWKIFRHRPLHSMLPWSVYYISVMVLAASICGWLYLDQDMVTAAWSGSAGIVIAQFLMSFTGQFGPIIILGSLTIIALLFLVDRDIQATIDRVKEWMGRNKKQKSQVQADLFENPQKESGSKDTKVSPAASSSVSDESNSKQNSQSEAETAGEASLDDIITQSSQTEKNRIKKQQQEEADIENRPPRAILDKPSEDSPETPAGDDADTKKDGKALAAKGEEEDDLEISVYVGKEEEEVGEKALQKENKNKAKEQPVIKYKFPGLDLLDSPPEEGNEVDFEEINSNKMIILDKLKRHGIEITGIEAIVGPTVTLYELQPAPDVKISKIESYANDLKMAMATRGLRIIAPIPGKSKVGIEVPNRKSQTVYIKSLLKTKKFVETRQSLPIAFGRTIENEVFMLDLASLPHLLIAGATGSGKSVGINTIITSLLYKCHPEELKFVLVDPKKIELSLYRKMESHYLASLPGEEESIITDTQKVLETLNSVCKEMDNRYDLLKLAMVRDIKSYNKKFKKGGLDPEEGHRNLPYIVVIIDEMADLMMTAGKAIEEPIARIAQLARAVGIHLVLATQRPSVNVITGTIKANFPARIAYRVASKVDSRTILDTMGAEQLVGKGDMLFSGGAGMVRIQNAFVSTDEVERITEFIGEQEGYNRPYHLPLPDEAENGGGGELEERDELFEEAAKVVVLHQKGSVSLVQRKLKLGYNRAGRIVDQLYMAGIVGPSKGSAAREVLVADEEELNDLLEALND